MVFRAHRTTTVVAAFVLANTAGSVSVAQAPVAPARPGQPAQFPGAIQQLRVVGVPAGPIFSLRGAQVDVPVSVQGGVPPYAISLDTTSDAYPPVLGDVLLLAPIQTGHGLGSTPSSVRTVRLVRTDLPTGHNHFRKSKYELRARVRDAAGTIVEVPMTFVRTYTSGPSVIQRAELQTFGTPLPVDDAPFFDYRLTLTNYDTREFVRIECVYGVLAVECDPQYGHSNTDAANQLLTSQALPEITVRVPRVDRGLTARADPTINDTGVKLRVRNSWGLGPDFAILWPKLPAPRPPDIRVTHNFTIAGGQPTEFPLQPAGLPATVDCDQSVGRDDYGLRPFWSQVQLAAASNGVTLLASAPNSAVGPSNLPRLMATSPGQHSATVDYFYYRRVQVCRPRVVCPEDRNRDISRTCLIPIEFH